MKPRLLKRSFTMIELVVSLGVFSILTLLLMQFFTSAQNAWTTSERRAQLYADSRVVFDMIANAAKAAPREQITFSSTANEATLSCPETTTDGTQGTFALQWSKTTTGDDKNRLMLSGTRSGTLLDGVMKFEVNSYKNDFTSAGSESPDSKFLVVRLQLLSYPDYLEYQEVPSSAQSDYLTNHAYNFVRMIILP